MGKNDFKYIIVFTSYQRVFYIYNILKLKNIESKIVTAPYKFNISCTQALKIREKDEEAVKHELNYNNIYPTAIFRIIKTKKGEDYELIE